MIRRKIQRSFRLSKYVVYKETLVDFKEQFWSFLGSFVGIGLIAFFQTKFISIQDSLFLIGSFGASSVLVFGAIQSPLAQPRNLLGGHLLSAIIGVTINKILPDIIWLAAPLSVSTSIVIMQITKTLHPPGGATALIAVIGSEKVKSLGYFFVISPVLSGAMILFLVAILFNNLTSHRHYPYNEKYKNILQRLYQRSKFKNNKLNTD